VRVLLLNSFLKAQERAEEDAQKAAKDAKRGITPRECEFAPNPLRTSRSSVRILLLNSAIKAHERAQEDSQKAAKHAKTGITPVGPLSLPPILRDLSDLRCGSSPIHPSKPTD
jgi:hypothetical protein